MISLSLVCCIAWGLLTAVDAVAWIAFKKSEMPTFRLIVAELLVFLLYLTAYMTTN